MRYVTAHLYFPEEEGNHEKNSLALAARSAALAARAEQVVVSNYAVTTNGMPFAVAMEKGYFKEFKVNVDGILTSDGGGTTIRNLLGGKLSYGEPRCRRSSRRYRAAPI